jgi:uncharacterized protein (DUF305 family)
MLAAAVFCGVGIAACAGESSKESRSAAPTFDRAFIDAMVPHHEAAVEMADAARKEGLRQPVLARLARAIARSQQREIEKMRAWREKWYGSTVIDPNGGSAIGLTPAEMGMSGHGTHQIMSGTDVDRAFADAMIPHHEGAVKMAKLALRKAEHGELIELSTHIIASQSAEIRILRRFSRKPR